MNLPIRPRRNRQSPAIRDLVRETELTPGHLIYPLFLQEGEASTPIDASNGGVARLPASRDAQAHAREAGTFRRGHCTVNTSVSLVMKFWPPELQNSVAFAGGRKSITCTAN